ncbi:methyltransferase [Microbacterium sp. W1N]|uniref:methyltransferase n=1 Tax=Microbacterium festucae TaxID=2977531 RepID=UPI0021C0BD97|nr:methyltransferase [Microbacterium festucae]MCT9820273.1 methyltransferase [Microbacterium festucae]
MSTTASTLWVAQGAEGNVVGSIRKDGDGYTVTIAGADASVGTYPTMDVAKNALHSHLTPGADWPRFVEH